MRPFARRSAGWEKAWVQDSAFVLLSQMTTLAAGFLVVVILARQLGPSDFGIFSALYAISQSLAMIVDFGLGQYVLRELSALNLSRDPSADARVHAADLISGGTGLVVILATPLIPIVAVVSAIGGWAVELSVGLLGLMAYTFILACSTVVECGFRASRRYRIVTCTVMLEKALLLAGLGVVLTSGGGILEIAGCYVIAGLTRLAVDVLVLRTKLAIVLHLVGLRACASIVRRAAPFAINRATSSLVIRLDVALVALFSTVSAAYYAVGDRTNTMLLIAIWSLTSTLYPFLQGSIEERIDRSLAVAAVTALIGVAVAITGILAAPQALSIAFGSKYTGASG